MINGSHFLLYSAKPDEDRAFLKDVLKFSSVDVGHGWLIFKLPPSEIAVHPADKTFTHTEEGRPMLGAVLYLMCDDLKETMKDLGDKVRFGEIQEAPWGIVTTFGLPSGASIGLYQPKHPTAYNLP